MNLKFIDQIGFSGRRPYGLFLLEIGGIEQAVKQHKKVVLIGVGINSYYTEQYLSKKGIEIYAYADNDYQRQTQMYKGKKVYSPFDLFGQNDVYFIVCVPEHAIAKERIQLMTHGITGNYSIVFRDMFHDYTFENENIQKAMLSAINYLIFEKEDINKILPYIGLATGKDGRQLGNINYLLMSTVWPHLGYIWMYDFLTNNPNSKMVDIGPGFGLLAYIFLDLFENLKVTLVNLGESGGSVLLASEESDFERTLMKVCDRFQNRVDYKVGMIERDDCLEEQYDLIVLTEVFEHFVHNPVKTMKRLSRRLKSEGVIMLTTPNIGKLPTYNTWKELPEVNDLSETEYFERIDAIGHVYQYSYDECVDIFNEAGLKVEKYGVSDGDSHNFFLRKI